jgi:hypothetical protein
LFPDRLIFDADQCVVALFVTTVSLAMTRAFAFSPLSWLGLAQSLSLLLHFAPARLIAASL